MGQFAKIWWARLQRLTTVEFWNESDHPWVRRGWLFIRFCRFVLDGFIRNRCPLRAAALAYTTLLALIPLLAIVVGILTSMLKTDGAKGEEMIESFIETLVANVAPALDLVDRAEEKLKSEGAPAVDPSLQTIPNSTVLDDSDSSSSLIPSSETNWVSQVDPTPQAESLSESVSDLESGTGSDSGPSIDFDKLTDTSVLSNEEETAELGSLENLTDPGSIPLATNTIADVDRASNNTPTSSALKLESDSISGTGPEDPSEPKMDNSGRKAVVAKIMDFIDNVNSGSLGVTGAFTLVLVAISLLSTIEGTFNDIWMTSRGRGWFDQMINYWAAITLGPLLIAVAFTSGPYLRSMEIWLAKAPVAAQFKAKEIRDPALLSKKLTPSPRSSELSEYLYQSFPAPVQSDLKVWSKMVSATSNPDLSDAQVLEIRRARESLAQALNEIIAKDNLFKGSRFAGIYLDPLTYEWLKKNPKNEDLKRLNRLLLEQAFPTCLAPTHVSRLRSILEGLAAPFLILLTAFVLFYKFMPYAEVNWRSALVGGGVGAFLWQTNISFSVIYISKVVSDSRIYSGFGMLPLFLLGLYISWLIVLLGAQVTCTFQNRLVLFQQQKIHTLPQREKEFVALWIMSQIAARFAVGATPPTEIELAGELDLSVNSLDPILKRLKEEGILIEVARKSPSFAPGRPLENISCLEVLECMRSTANEQPFDPEDLKGHSEESTRLLTGLRHTFGEIQGAEREVAEGISVRDLLKQSPVEPETA